MCLPEMFTMSSMATVRIIRNKVTIRRMNKVENFGPYNEQYDVIKLIFQKVSISLPGEFHPYIQLCFLQTSTN